MFCTFDNVAHVTFFEKLREFGVHGLFVTLLTEYQAYRTQYAVINGIK